MDELIKPTGIPEWMWQEVVNYDLPLAQPPRTVLDIGANIGAFTLLANQRWPEARITAVEPVGENLQEFMRNVNLPQAQLLPVAVRAREGAADIFIGDQGTTCGFHQLGRQSAATQRVSCVEAATLEPAEFVKVDTEGCEVEILRGLNLTATLVLCVEYHRPEDVTVLKEIAAAAELKLHREKSLGPDSGLLVFARLGALVAPPKVFIALPVYGSLEVFFAQSLIKVINEPPVPMMLRMNPGDSLVARSRNTLTADFLESDATHLLFIDTDLVFGADHIARIMSHREDIVGGFYPKKQEGPVEWVCNGCVPPPPPRADGLQAVRYMGTGFLRVARGVFERMIAAYGAQIGYKPDHRERPEYDFWSVGPYQYADGSRRYLSEDWFFCQRALDLGYAVWGDTRIALKHVGQAVYPLRSQQEAIFAPAATAVGSDRAGGGSFTLGAPARQSLAEVGI